jgi:hypothetical protein
MAVRTDYVRQQLLKYSRRPPPPSTPPAWGSVADRADSVVIVASGPSLRDITVKDIMAFAGVTYIIAVNRAINHIDAHAFFTCDPGPKILPVIKRMKAGCRYYVAIPDNYGTPQARLLFHRHPPIAGPIYLRRMEGTDPMGSRYGLSEDPAAISTGNSAYGALGVAYHMRPRRILLLGVDGTKEGYAWDGGSPSGNLAHLPYLFASALPQLAAARIEVVNGNVYSKVTCFPRTLPGSGLDWIGGKPLINVAT